MLLQPVHFDGGCGDAHEPGVPQLQMPLPLRPTKCPGSLCGLASSPPLYPDTPAQLQLAPSAWCDGILAHYASDFEAAADADAAAAAASPAAESAKTSEPPTPPMPTLVVLHEDVFPAAMPSSTIARMLANHAVPEHITAVAVMTNEPRPPSLVPHGLPPPPARDALHSQANAGSAADAAKSQRKVVFQRMDESEDDVASLFTSASEPAAAMVVVVPKSKAAVYFRRPDSVNDVRMRFVDGGSLGLEQLTRLLGIESERRVALKPLPAAADDSDQSDEDAPRCATVLGSLLAPSRSRASMRRKSAASLRRRAPTPDDLIMESLDSDDDTCVGVPDTPPLSSWLTGAGADSLHEIPASVLDAGTPRQYIGDLDIPDIDESCRDGKAARWARSRRVTTSSAEIAAAAALATATAPWHHKTARHQQERKGPATPACARSAPAAAAAGSSGRRLGNGVWSEMRNTILGHWWSAKGVSPAPAAQPVLSLAAANSAVARRRQRQRTPTVF
ncbi:hypothetical protein HK105_206066 [Polyrhizophydium stewartii]|uniref:Uncharacterized protein n=1 Tax=Polyrhizophydium stewartii TaxID=2732419 RepID=A0ABR4N4U8_9FUNG